jgi:hypothetical protein
MKIQWFLQKVNEDSMFLQRVNEDSMVSAEGK